MQDIRINICVDWFKYNIIYKIFAKKYTFVFIFKIKKNKPEPLKYIHDKVNLCPEQVRSANNRVCQMALYILHSLLTRDITYRVVRGTLEKDEGVEEK